MLRTSLYFKDRIQNLAILLNRFFITNFTLPIYLGWITVATIANFTVLLVSEGWGGFGIRDETWTVFVIILGAIIGLLTLMKYSNIEYGVTLIWAYYGIYARHASIQELIGSYPMIEYTVIICIVLIISSIIHVRMKFNKN